MLIAFAEHGPKKRKLKIKSLINSFDQEVLIFWGPDVTGPFARTRLSCLGQSFCGTFQHDRRKNNKRVFFLSRKYGINSFSLRISSFRDGSNSKTVADGCLDKSCTCRSNFFVFFSYDRREIKKRER